VKSLRIGAKKTAKACPSLADILQCRALQPAEILATYNDIHPEDTCADFRSVADAMNVNAHHLLDRMQDGPRIANDARVMSFVAIGDGRARLTAFRRFSMRRQGIVPTDIVYDYDAAHLLHAFIARASLPFFYDAWDEDGLDDLIGHLIVKWPEGRRDDILYANDPLLLTNT
jgi:hypothetical protein